MSADEPMPTGAKAIYASRIGYVQHIDIDALDSFAKRNKASIFVAALPGTFVHERRPVAHFVGDSEDDIEAHRAWRLHRRRRAILRPGPPRFGLCVLSEIASRALSPAMNDPGTAIDVLGRTVRILGAWAEEGAPQRSNIEHVHVPGLRLADLFDDVFSPIERDGAAIAEVQIRLQKTFVALAAFEGQERYRENAESAFAAGLGAGGGGDRLRARPGTGQGRCGAARITDAVAALSPWRVPHRRRRRSSRRRACRPRCAAARWS